MTSRMTQEGVPATRVDCLEVVLGELVLHAMVMRSPTSAAVALIPLLAGLDPAVAVKHIRRIVAVYAEQWGYATRELPQLEVRWIGWLMQERDRLWMET